MITLIQCQILVSTDVLNAHNNKHIGNCLQSLLVSLVVCCVSLELVFRCCLIFIIGLGNVKIK